MKKLGILIFLFIGIIMFLFACSEDTADENVEIRLLTRMAGESQQVEIYRDIIEEFEEEHPDVTVTDESEGDDDNYNNKLKSDLSSGTLPNIFRIEGQGEMERYIENGLLMDLDPIIKDDPEWSEGFVEGALKYNEVPGHEGTYGIPMENGLIGVYYNQQLLNEASVDKFPETWNEFLDSVKKLKSNDIKPIALGGQTPFMIGHLHNLIFYHRMGIEAAEQLGTRDLKWTNEDVVDTFADIKELDSMGAFGEGAAGITEEVAINEFLAGNAAMFISGPWQISRLVDEDETDISDNFEFAKFPYYANKEEYKNEDMQVLSSYMVNGELEGKEKEYTIELLKKLTSSEAANRFAEEAQFLIPRTDIEIDKSSVPDLFNEMRELSSESTRIATDITDFDPVSSLKDKRRDILQGLIIDLTPEQAAEQTQEVIDKSE